MDSKTTTLFSVEEIDEALIKKTLQEIYVALEERGHNPVNQIEIGRASCRERV